MQIIPKKYSEPIAKIFNKIKPKKEVTGMEERKQKEDDYYKRVQQVNPNLRSLQARRKSIRERHNRYGR